MMPGAERYRVVVSHPPVPADQVVNLYVSIGIPLYTAADTADTLEGCEPRYLIFRRPSG